MASLWSLLRKVACAPKLRLSGQTFSSCLKNFLNLLSVAALFGYSQFALAAKEYDFPEQVTEIGRDITALHHTIFFICLGIMAFVTIWMFYSIFAHRKSKGVEAAQFSHSTSLEILWTIIPVIILIVMAVPATKLLIKMEDTTKSDLTIKATGFQWKWGYEYFDSGLKFYSTISTPRDQIDQYNGSVPQGENYLQEVDNHVVIPSGKKVRLLLTADDVIHAWWVPKLGGKKDAIPGYINKIWFEVDEGKEGTYRGRCAELCGKDHAYMPIVVDVVSLEEYKKWVAVNKKQPRGVIKNIADIRQSDTSKLISGDIKTIISAPSTLAN